MKNGFEFHQQIFADFSGDCLGLSVCEVVQVSLVDKAEYIFHGLGQMFHLVLSPDTVDIHNNNNNNNNSWPGCYYSGYVKGVESSSVGVSICGGLVSMDILVCKL